MIRSGALAVFALAGATVAFTDKPTIPCAVTQAIKAEPPRDPNADAFGPGPWYINADRTIWAGADATHMREGRNKVIWIRPQGTELRVSGHRLDRESRELTAHIPCCYPTGFQATMLTLPSTGCWEIKATAGASQLTFITDVKAKRPPGSGAEQ